MRKKAETDSHKKRINGLVKETGVPKQVAESITDGVFDKKRGICRRDIYKGYPAMVQKSKEKIK